MAFTLGLKFNTMELEQFSDEPGNNNLLESSIAMFIFMFMFMPMLRSQSPPRLLPLPPLAAAAAAEKVLGLK